MSDTCVTYKKSSVQRAREFWTMSAFYTSTSAGGQLTMQDIAPDHRGPLVPSVFAAGQRAPAASSPTEPPAVERSSASLASRAHSFPPPNFLSYPNAADFRDFCPPAAAAADVSAAAKSFPTALRCHSDGSKQDVSRGLDLTGIEMRNVYKTAPTAAVDQPPLGSSTSSSSSQRHPDQSPHLQHYCQLRSELLQQQQQQLQRDEELFLQQARQWYLNQSPTTPAAEPRAGDLVNGQSASCAPPPVFRHEATAPLLDISPGGGPQCHWPPPTYSSPATPRHEPSDPHQNLELSPTQKTAGSGVNGVPFYPWMSVVGRYACRQPDVRCMFSSGPFN